MLFCWNFLGRLRLLGNSWNWLFHFIFFDWSFEVLCLWATCWSATLSWISNLCLLQLSLHESLHFFFIHRFSEASTSLIRLNEWLPRVHTDFIVQNILRVYHIWFKYHWFYVDICQLWWRFWSGCVRTWNTLWCCWWLLVLGKLLLRFLRRFRQFVKVIVVEEFLFVHKEVNNIVNLRPLFEFKLQTVF